MLLPPRVLTSTKPLRSCAASYVFHSCGLRRPPLAVQLVAVRVKKKLRFRSAAAGGARARQLQKRRRAAGCSERGAVFRVAGAERARLRFGVVWCNACAAIAAAAEVDGISGGNAGA